MYSCKICKAKEGNVKLWSTLDNNIKICRCEICNCFFAEHKEKNAHENLHKSSKKTRYNTHYEFANLIKESIKYGEITKLKEIYNKNFKYNFLLEEIKNLNYKPTILEIGCSTGHFVAYLRFLGYESYGIDISKSAIDHAQSNFGNFFNTNLEKLAKDKFDVVISAGTVGCVNNPIKFVNSMIKVSLDKNIKGLVLFNAPSAKYIDQTKFDWPGTKPPNLNLLFSNDFWLNYAKDKGLDCEQSILKVNFLKYFIEEFRNVIRNFRIKSSIKLLKSFLIILSNKKVSHPYGLLVKIKKN